MKKEYRSYHHLSIWTASILEQIKEKDKLLILSF